MKLGQYIQTYRDSHSLSMGDFAKLAGISKAYVSMLEVNKNTNGKPIAPSVTTLKKVAAATNISLNELLRILGDEQDILLNEPMPVSFTIDAQRDVTNATPTPLPPNFSTISGEHRIPVLGRVVAGTPIEAVEDIRGYIEIDSKMAKNGKYLALEVKGASMEPTLHEGDIIVVKLQEDIESGEMAVVMVNGDEATVKEVKESEAGLTLIGHNVAVYTPHFYSWEEVASLPIKIIGKVVELRRKL